MQILLELFEFLSSKFRYIYAQIHVNKPVRNSENKIAWCCKTTGQEKFGTRSCRVPAVHLT